MSEFTPESKALLHYHDHFKNSHILFSGNIRDDLPVTFTCANSRVHTQFYHHWKMLNRKMGNRVRFSLVAKPFDISNCDTLIYYWPKNKSEAYFQLMNLLSLLSTGRDVFIVGENYSGVRSAPQILEKWVLLNKISSAHHCSLYHGCLEKQPIFSIKKFWSEYCFNGLIIRTLPGVFSHGRLDVGSQLLLSTLTSHIKGKILDIGCGSGVLSAVLASKSSKVCLNLCDSSAAAIAASLATLSINGFEGSVFFSNIFSDVIGHYDLIIANPPFHDGIKVNLKVAKQLIHDAVYYLSHGGELRIIANSFLPYSKMLNEAFGFHEIIAQTRCFKVYRAVMRHYR